MLESGVASAEDIDRGMELGYRHPMGPLKLTALGMDLGDEVPEALKPRTIAVTSGPTARAA